MSLGNHLKRVLLTLSSTLTVLVLGLVVASATTAGHDALRSTAARATLLASTTPVRADAAGSTATGPGLGPIQITIGSTWNLDGQLLASGTATLTCRAFSSDESSSAQITIEEAVGDKVGHGFASIPQLRCDGAAHRYPVTALVNDVPFRPSDGAALVDASACGLDPSSFRFVCQAGHALATIRIVK